jgi:hypothetical protein
MKKQILYSGTSENLDLYSEEVTDTLVIAPIRRPFLRLQRGSMPPQRCGRAGRRRVFRAQMGTDDRAGQSTRSSAIGCLKKATHKYRALNHSFSRRLSR